MNTLIVDMGKPVWLTNSVIATANHVLEAFVFTVEMSFIAFTTRKAIEMRFFAWYFKIDLTFN